MMSQWVTHHDARWWPDADTFDPGRWLGDGHARGAAGEVRLLPLRRRRAELHRRGLLAAW